MPKNDMAETGITCRTFANRVFKCNYYSEKEDYVKNMRLLFNQIFREYIVTSNKTILEIFADKISSRAFTGIRSIYADHVISYKEYALTCAIALQEFFNKMNPTNVMDKYIYKHKIKGYIGCRIKNANVWFSYKNAAETEKDLDFAQLNNYIYNRVYDLSNDCLVMSVPTQSFFRVKYENCDYTMGRGFLVQTKKTKLRRAGSYCIRCKNSCKPLFINGLDRLEGIS